jgi:hypothetical protein
MKHLAVFLNARNLMMIGKSKLIYLCFFISLQSIGYSQLFTNYTSTRTTGNPYSSISSSGSSVGSWRNTGAFSQDDNRSLFIDIGFDFWYAGVRYTSISISTNGFIDFSNSTDDGGPQTDDFGYANNAFTSVLVGDATRPSIAPMYDDLTAQGGVDSLGNAIKYQLTGTAPNRIFTVEWIDMAVYLNTTPSLNFQVKIYERTGVIDFVYGTMINGVHTFSYTCGLNGTTMNVTPTNAQLKAQQTANTNTFSAGEVNNLVTIPATNSLIKFTPPVPANPPGPLTFSAITNSSMTLNWANWATNEVGYVIYNSIDGINYYFVTQTAANATNANITGLSPNITYFWRVMAVTEGCLSNQLSGSQATLPAGNKLSNVANGTWNDPNDWTPIGVPTLSDNVTIRNGHTITIDVNASCNDLLVGFSGGNLIIGNNNTARAITIGGNISVTGTGNFSVSGTSNTTHTMNFKGKILNNGTLNFRPDANSFCDITFSRINSQSIAGTGATNNYNNMILSLGSGFNDSLFVTSTIFTAPTNFLTINSGAFKLSSTNTSTFVFTNAYNIGQYAGIINDNPNATFDFQAGLTLEGLYKNMRGNLIVGNAANENLVSNGGILKIQNGSVNIAGRYFIPNINNLALFSISGGTMTLPTVGSTSTTVAPFQIVGSGSTFNMSGGSIIIQREGGTGAQNLGYVVTGATTSNVTGGTLQIGDATTPPAQNMQINTNVGVGNLLVNSANATGTLLTNHLNVINNVTIAFGALNSNTRNITLGGNWSNSGTWTPSTGTVTFGGSSNHTLVNTLVANENFNNLSTSGTGTLTLNDPVTLTGNINIGNGSGLNVNAANHTINLRGNWTNNGTFTQQNGLVNMNGTIQQSFNGIATTFHNYTLNNSAGAIVNSGIYTINNLYTPTLGTLNTNGQTWIFESDGTNESRISAFNASSGITGNVTTRRFINSGIGGYRDLGVAHLSGATVSSFDDDMYISGSPSAGFADGCAMGPPCFYSFKLLNNNVYTDITNASTVIGNTQGVHAWVADGYPSSLSAPINIDLTGTVKPFANVNVNVAGAGGTLIGNPYISQIDFDNISRAGVGDFYYMYDVNITNFNWYQIANLSSPLTNIISKGQGFVVYGPGTLTFSETNKTGAASVFIRNQNEDVFVLDIKDINKENVSCNAMLNLTEGESGKTSIPLLRGIDTNSIYVSTRGNNFSEVTFRYENLAINDFMEIPVYVEVNSKANLQLSLVNTELLRSFECVEIIDQKTKKVYTLDEAEMLQFNQDSSQNSTPRFIIRLAKTCDDLEQNWADFYYANNYLNFTVRNASEGILNVEVVDLAGRLVLSQQVQNSSQWFQVADSDLWKNGTYITRLTSGNLSKSWKFTVIR